MTGELEAAGAMATAGLVAGAIEGREPGKAGEGACLNCGAELQGKFCHSCGQAARANRKAVHLLEEVLHSLFYFDTKLWRTAPMLLGRPGTLTRNYIYGKRARYVSPLATFLLAIFFMFLAIASLNEPENGAIRLDGEPRAELVEDLARARTDLTEAESELAQAQANPDPEPTEGLNVRLAEGALRRAQAAVTRQEQALARRDAREAESARVAAEAAASGSTEVETTTVAPGVRVERSATEPEADTWQEQVARWARREDSVFISGFPELNRRALQTLQNPDLAKYKILEAASKFSFLLVPISLPFIWLLFIWKRGLTLYDHSVYALYALSFAALVFVAVIGAAQVPWLRWAIPVLLFVVMPVHMFFQLKGAYALGWWSALWRTFFMTFFAITVLTLFVIAVILLGLAG